MKTDPKLVSRHNVSEDLLVFFDLVTLLFATPRLFIDFFYMTGYDLGKLNKPGPAGASKFDKAYAIALETRNLYESVRENIPADWTSWEAVKKGLFFGKQVWDSVEQIKGVLELAGSEDDLDMDWEAFFLHLVEQLVLRSHQQLMPAAMQTYILLDWVHPARNPDLTEPEVDTTGSVIRYPYRGIRFNKDGLGAFFRSPLEAMRNKYFPSELARDVLADPGEDELFVRLRDWLKSLHPAIGAIYGYKDIDGLDLSDAQREAFAKTLSLWFPLGDSLEAGISLRRIVKSGGRQAIEVAPALYWTKSTGEIDRDATGADLQNKSFTSGLNWKWDLLLNGSLNAFTFGPGGISLPDTPGTLDFRISGKRGGDTPDPELGPAYRIGPDEGTRLEIGNMAFSLALHLDAQKQDAAFEFKASDCGFYLIPGDGDSFLKKILPEDGIQNTFDLAVGYANDRGFYVEGGLGGEIVIPINKKFGKSVTIPDIQLGFRKLEGNQRWMLYASLSGRLQLGPIAANVDKMGIRALLSPPGNGQTGNLGFANAELDFKAPDGIGIEINAKVVTGGGYLYCDPDRGEYMGVAQLNIKNKINLKAFGILLTKMPGGQKGYSFLLMISAEFPAVPLGLGFKLTGVGGLLGIHRRIEVAKLTEGLRTNNFDDILFPKAPLENPYGLLNKLNAIFPPAEGQYVVGLMGQIEWGPKNLVTIELGLIVEFTEPVRLALIGVLKAVVSKEIAGEERTVLQLQVNFAGIFDFEKRFIRFDATLFESTLLGMKLEGDMALRIKYGPSSDFALTIGGFHPDFQPPALDLPANIRRLQITLRPDNPSIIVTAYVAVTSNTFQFGAAGIFKFEKWGVKIRGELAFDALFQFSPFRFEVSLYFLLSASWHGYEFAAIEIDGMFSGPSPWYIAGSLRLKVWIFSKTVHIEEAWGEDDNSRLESVRVLPLLTEDLRLRSNWETKTGRTRGLVTLRRDKETAAASEQMFLHPNELIVVRQNTVPLGLKIDKFGERRPEGASKFRIELTGSDNKALAATPVKNHFASAQFVSLSDEQKLQAPSYELFESGLGFEGMDEVSFDSLMTVQPVEYEYKIIGDPDTATTDKKTIKETAGNFGFGLRNNAVANSAFGRIAKAARPPVNALAEKYVVAWQKDLKTYQQIETDSEAEARQLLRDLIRENPRRKSELMVLLKAEAVNG